MELKTDSKERLDKALAGSGLRTTRQREQVYGIITAESDHPTAEEIFARAKVDMPTISLATVYNCLDTLVECGLIRQVNFERESSRFCPNLEEHAHFYCKKSGKVYDIDLTPGALRELKCALPDGFEIEACEVTFRGNATEAKSS